MTLLIECYRFGQNNGILTIGGAVPDDAGNYTCTATNDAGTASQSVALTYAGSLEGADVFYIIF